MEPHAQLNQLQTLVPVDRRLIRGGCCQTGTPAVPEPLRGFQVSDAEWVKTFYPWLEHHANWELELRAAEDHADDVEHPPVALRFVREPDDIATYLRLHRDLATQRADRLQMTGSGPWPAGLFWGLQPRVSQRDGRVAVAALVALGCSTDCGEWAAWPLKERPRVMWEALHCCPVPPSVITWTGSGFDAWWLLNEPFLDGHRGEEVQKAIARCLHADPTQDAMLLFRWPHSVNYRGLPHEPPRLVRVAWWQPQMRFSFDTLRERFMPAPADQATRWSRFLRMLPQPAKMMWSSFSGGLPSTQEPCTLNLALASTLLLHDGHWDDFATIARMAPWNTDYAPTVADLEHWWRKARGTPQPLSVSQSEGMAQPLASSPAPVEPALPGLLLDDLPETAWTEWARLYRTAVAACTEAADEFHYLAILTVLGTAFGRSVVVHSGRPVYLNTYTVLVGPTGDRKSTAAQLALELLPQVMPRTLLLNGVGSQEGVMERMASQDGANPTLWFVDEVASLLRKARRESSGGLLEFITELFHCPDFKTHSTRSRAIHLQSPTLNILAGSTPTWLESTLQQDDILGGFANRFVYVTGRPKPDNPLPSRPDTKALLELVAWMRRATQVPPRELSLACDAQVLWNDFYLDWRRTTAACSEQVAALLRRIDLYILKFAAMSAAMDGTSEITSRHLTSAIDLGRFLAGCAYRLLGDIGASNDCRLEKLIDRKLRDAQGQMRRKQLRQALSGRVSGEKLDRVLVAMERNGLIRQVDDRTARGSSRLVQLT